MHKKKLMFLAVALLDSTQNIGFSIFLQWPVYVIGISWLNCRIPCHLKATSKDRCIRGYSVTTYPLSKYLSIMVTGYPHNYSCINYDIHLTQHIRLMVCLFVVLKATEGRKVHKRHNCISTYLALSGIQLQSGRVFGSCSHI